MGAHFAKKIVPWDSHALSRFGGIIAHGTPMLNGWGEPPPIRLPISRTARPSGCPFPRAPPKKKRSHQNSNKSLPMANPCAENRPMRRSAWGHATNPCGKAGIWANAHAGWANAHAGKNISRGSPWAAHAAPTPAHTPALPMPVHASLRGAPCLPMPAYSRCSGHANKVQFQPCLETNASKKKLKKCSGRANLALNMDHKNAKCTLFFPKKPGFKAT